MVTAKEIAKRARVFRSTVQRALSGSPKISVVAKKRILQTAEALGYRPNRSGKSRSSSSGRTWSDERMEPITSRERLALEHRGSDGVPIDNNGVVSSIHQVAYRRPRITGGARRSNCNWQVLRLPNGDILLVHPR